MRALTAACGLLVLVACTTAPALKPVLRNVGGSPPRAAAAPSTPAGDLVCAGGMFGGWCASAPVFCRATGGLWLGGGCLRPSGP